MAYDLFPVGIYPRWRGTGALAQACGLKPVCRPRRRLMANARHASPHSLRQKVIPMAFVNVSMR